MVAPVASATVLGLIGFLGMASGMAWLFPSLGPSIAIQTSSPDRPISRPKNVIVGHLVGLVAGFLAVFFTGADSVPPVGNAGFLTEPRVAAGAMAILVSMVVQQSLRVRHPPAEATTLLVALGAFPPTLHTVVSVIAGVLLVAGMGEVARRAAEKAGVVE